MAVLCLFFIPPFQLSFPILIDLMLYSGLNIMILSF